MKFTGIIVSALIPAAFASPIGTDSDNDGLAKLDRRQAWSAYLYAADRCVNSIGGFSNFGSRGCTQVSATSAEADPQGCRITFFTSPNCSTGGFAFDGPGCAEAGGSPGEIVIRSFLVSC
jgi:hypothetical protein